MEPPVPKAQLVVSGHGRPDATIDLGECLTIGRSPQNDLVLDDHRASRRHAEIRHDGRGGYSLLDAGSANGTTLNGRMLSAPRRLTTGDLIGIGDVRIRFLAPRTEPGPAEPAGAGAEKGTDLSFRYETVVVMVADIRNYTTMSEVLPNREFSLLIADWFKKSGTVIEQHGGTIDKFIGDAVMSYWLVREPAHPAPEVDGALRAARDLLQAAAAFGRRLAAQFPEQTFRVGIGLNLGVAVVGNVGGAEHQSFTVVGDSVNVAFRLEALTKEKGCSVVVSGSVTEHASGEFAFRDLGRAEVKGRTEPVSIWALCD